MAPAGSVVAKLPWPSAGVAPWQMRSDDGSGGVGVVPGLPGSGASPASGSPEASLLVASSGWVGALQAVTRAQARSAAQSRSVDRNMGTVLATTLVQRPGQAQSPRMSGTLACRTVSDGR